MDTPYCCHRDSQFLIQIGWILSYGTAGNPQLFHHTFYSFFVTLGWRSFYLMHCPPNCPYVSRFLISPSPHSHSILFSCSPLLPQALQATLLRSCRPSPSSFLNMSILNWVNHFQSGPLPYHAHSLCTLQPSLSLAFLNMFNIWLYLIKDHQMSTISFSSEADWPAGGFHHSFFF